MNARKSKLAFEKTSSYEETHIWKRQSSDIHPAPPKHSPIYSSCLVSEDFIYGWLFNAKWNVIIYSLLFSLKPAWFFVFCAP